MLSDSGMYVHKPQFSTSNAQDKQVSPETSPAAINPGLQLVQRAGTSLLVQRQDEGHSLAGSGVHAPSSSSSYAS